MKRLVIVMSFRREFFHRVLVFVVTAVGLFLALLWQSTEVILLIFAGLLLAVLLDGIANWVSRYTPLSKGRWHICWCFRNYLLKRNLDSLEKKFRSAFDFKIFCRFRTNL